MPRLQVRSLAWAPTKSNRLMFLSLSFFPTFLKSINMSSEDSGVIGATIKDTRTKSKGRVEVGEGGGTGWGGV